MPNATLEEQITSLEKTLSGSEDTNKDKETRLAIIRQSAQYMDEDEKKEARKALDDDDGDHVPKKANDDEEKNKDAKKANDDDEKNKDAKKANEELDKMKKSMQEKDKQIASLTASVSYMQSAPTVEKMLAARRNAGMQEDDIAKFKKSLYGKSVNDIKTRYEEDKILFANQKIAMPLESDTEFPFNGNTESILTGSDGSEKTLEELFN